MLRGVSMSGRVVGIIITSQNTLEKSTKKWWAAVRIVYIYIGKAAAVEKEKKKKKL